jgi:hypothetical protein
VELGNVGYPVDVVFLITFLFYPLTKETLEINTTGSVSTKLILNVMCSETPIKRIGVSMESFSLIINLPHQTSLKRPLR